MLERSEYALSSLKKVAEVCHDNGNTFTASIMGVVIDMTRPLFRQRDKDYIVELKIVDQLVNESQVHGILIKYCSVYVFSREKKYLQVCNKIGQIVYLNSFTFTLWNEIKLETKYRSTIQKLYTFDVNEDKMEVFKYLVATPEKIDIRNEEIVFRAKKLSKWFEKYFYEKYKPALGISLVNNYCVMAQPFNMILKQTEKEIEEVHQLENTIENHLGFEDSHGNRFIINKNCLPSVLPDTKYVFVRNINFIGNFYEIVLTETGYLLGLPEMYAHLYVKEMNYCAISRFNQRFLLKNHKTCNLSKINYVSPKTTPIIDLLNHMDLYQNKSSIKEDLRVEDLYMIEGVAINFHGKIHLFHSEYQMIADEEYILNLTDDERTQLIQKGTLQYLYEGVLGVIDRSSECTGRLLYVHLFSNEKRARFFDSSIIEGLNKSAGMGKNHELELRAKAEIDKKLQNLIEKSDFRNTISMLLEPIKSDVLLYRLTNTIFI